VALLSTGLACGRDSPHATSTPTNGAAGADDATSTGTRPEKADLLPSKDVTGSDEPPDAIAPDATDLALVVCGDGVRELREACDDGNCVSGDGWADDCLRVESGFHCMWPGRPCTPSCGDLLLAGSETRDDGNQANGDGCSEFCLAANRPAAG
jgi:cysteine-rich repeat protein